MPKPRVFVVHGRNLQVRDALCQFMICMGLDPLTWDDARQLTKEPNPHTLEIVKKGIELSDITVVVFTPDEKAQLRGIFVKNDDEKEPGFQPRPNVILEAGMAFIMRPELTVWVCFGEMRLKEMSDLAGTNYLNYTNSINDRKALFSRLNTALSNTKRSYKLDDKCITNLIIAPDSAFGTDFHAGSGSGGPSLAEFTIFRNHNVFQQGIDRLTHDDHRHVFIYAPTGAWDKVRLKDKWFETIAACIALNSGKKPRCVAKSLQEFIGVYGLPPVEKDAHGNLINSKKVEAQLKEMEDLLWPFNGLKHADLYYLNDVQNIPGGGAIIIDETMLTVAFATTQGYLADAGFTIFNEEEITKDAQLWFMNNIQRIVGKNILQRINDIDRILLKDTMNRIRLGLGLSPRTVYRRKFY